MKPATPLPWVVLPDYKVGRIEKDVAAWAYEGMPPDPSHRASWEDDAVYIVHAANAYPALVEALQKCAAGLEMAEEMFVEIQGGIARSKDAAAAHDLLTSLGERPE